jgi:hypothetical protein
MGQDRELSVEERRLVLNTVHKYISIWEASEISNLTKDRDLLISQLKTDTEFKTEFEEVLNEEINKQMEEFVLSKEEVVDDEEKNGLIS